MAGEMAPRLSDAEREQVMERLNQAVGEGRLTLPEFEDRVQGVLAARTQDELTPYLADLPAVAGSEEITLRPRASSLKRSGNWVVPRRINVDAHGSSVTLDLTEARAVAPTVELVLDLHGSSVTVVLPRGASASVDDVDLTASSAHARVPQSGGLHVTARGQLRASSVKVRYQRRFLWWRW